MEIKMQRTEDYVQGGHTVSVWHPQKKNGMWASRILIPGQCSLHSSGFWPTSPPGGFAVGGVLAWMSLLCLVEHLTTGSECHFIKPVTLTLFWTRISWKAWIPSPQNLLSGSGVVPRNLHFNTLPWGLATLHFETHSPAERKRLSGKLSPLMRSLFSSK